MKNISDPDRLRALLGTEVLARVRARLRARLRRAGDLRGTLVIEDATLEERAAVDALFGRKPTMGRLPINLDEVDRILRNAGIAGSFVDALEALEGPILAAREASLADDAAWSALQCAIKTKAAPDPSWINSWCDELVDSGVLRRLSRGAHGDAERWFDQALAILRRVPFSGVRLAQLAAEACGDSHALDDGEPVGTILMRGIEHAVGLAGTDTARRDLLAKAGIVADDLSAPALVLNLRATSTGLLASALNSFADAGEPLHVSARQLQREHVAFDRTPDDVVFACENPTVLAAAADAFGPSCWPLICTSGQARNAVRELLRRLRLGGIRVLYHGDFDWPGLTIARGLYARDEAEPWRMNTADYLAGPDGPALEGKAVETPWAPSLAPAMVARARVVHEEAVLAELLGDLGRAATPRRVP